MLFDSEIELALRTARTCKDSILLCHAVWDTIIVEACTISRIVDGRSMFTAIYLEL